MPRAMVGLRILSCFWQGGPTLTADEIGVLLDLRTGEVIRVASRLTSLGYLVAEPSGDVTAWTSAPDDYWSGYSSNV
jgi:DNA-binding IclR family transcriptional regulator